MNTKHDYEMLAHFLDNIARDSLDQSKDAIGASAACRHLARMDDATEQQKAAIRNHREYLMGLLVSVARRIHFGKLRELPELVAFAEEISIGLEGNKSERRRQKRQEKSAQAAPAK